MSGPLPIVTFVNTKACMKNKDITDLDKTNMDAFEQSLIIPACEQKHHCSSEQAALGPHLLYSRHEVMLYAIPAGVQAWFPWARSCNPWQFRCSYYVQNNQYLQKKKKKKLLNKRLVYSAHFRRNWTQTSHPSLVIQVSILLKKLQTGGL